jgi:hypothetical protein
MEQDSFEQIVSGIELEAPEGYVTVDAAALNEAIDYIRGKKETALDNEDDVEYARWRDEEKRMIVARALGGFVRID